MNAVVRDLKKILQGQSLTRFEASSLMERILAGEAVPEQIGALLIALQLKAESVDEIVGFVETLRAKARTAPLSSVNAIDVCGTGGDGSGTFNVSTTTAFVVAAAGLPIAKHGNRAISSASGSFDVLGALGIMSDESADDVRASMDDYGIAFMFAPAFHPVLKELAQLRRNLGVRTVFNLLGPLLNPAGVKRQLVGVYGAELVVKVALALQKLGAEEAIVVRGEDGLDELTLCGPTRVAHLRDGEVKTFFVTPEECGLRSARAEELRGGTAQENASILLKILGGEKGARRDLVLLNAAGALMVGGMAHDFKEGVERAASVIDSGRALHLLSRLQNRAVGPMLEQRSGT